MYGWLIFDEEEFNEMHRFKQAEYLQERWEMHAGLAEAYLLNMLRVYSKLSRWDKKRIRAIAFDFQKRKFADMPSKRLEKYYYTLSSLNYNYDDDIMLWCRIRDNRKLRKKLKGQPTKEVLKVMSYRNEYYPIGCRILIERVQNKEVSGCIWENILTLADECFSIEVPTATILNRSDNEKEMQMIFRDYEKHYRKRFGK